MSLYSEITQQDIDFSVFEQLHIQRFSTDEILQTIKGLMGQTQYKQLSRALGEAGLAIYPHDEELLTINSLMATLDKNWDQVFEWMKTLIDLRGDKNSSGSYTIFTNALIHRLDYDSAWTTVNQALKKFPEDQELQRLHLKISECKFHLENSKRPQ
jgi:uncharacterized lipoprotein